MALERFSKSSGSGDKLATADHLGKPFYIVPVSLETGIVTEHDATGEKVVIKAHAYDLTTDEVYANCLFFNDALRDGLKKYIGGATVVVFADIKPKSGKGKPYRGLEAADDAAWALAEKNEAKIEAAIAARVEELGSAVPAAKGTTQNATQASAVKGAFSR